MVPHYVTCLLFILSLHRPLYGIKYFKWKHHHKPSKITVNTQNAVIRDAILKHHNDARSKVHPTASNMLKMSWHFEAARQAQHYAEQCFYLKHNDRRENSVPLLGTCGQNLFVSPGKLPWYKAIQVWFEEHKKFTYGDPNVNLPEVGHYTQMVWATSFKLGCGVAHCPGGPWGQFYNYVCHYCPGGNIDTMIQYPYKSGQHCSDCPDHCTSDHLCTNECHARDKYSNCKDLVNYDYSFCENGDCNASCTCGNGIYKNYPWT